MPSPQPSPGVPGEGAGKKMPQPKIGILIVAYNAATTLRDVLHRIPPEIKAKTA